MLARSVLRFALASTALALPGALAEVKVIARQP